MENKIIVEFVNCINGDDKFPFFLPNSVQLLSNGDLVIADGGNDRICVLYHNLQPKKSIGQKGWGNYRFKEPVGAFVSPDDFIYVMDWHNHRVVIFDSELNYVNEFGHYGDMYNNLQNKISILLNILIRFALDGSYIPYHFINLGERRIKEKTFVGIKIFLLSIYGFIKTIWNQYRYQNNNYLFQNYINKPNGIAFYDQYLYLIQKNNKCISVHESNPPFKKIYDITAPKSGLNFGRLGNITRHSDGNFHICDEEKGVLWILNKKLGLIDKICGNDLEIDDFRPFSSCTVSEKMIAVCNACNFHLINLESKKCEFSSEIDGEFHGICFNMMTGHLYVSNRANGTILVYYVNRK